MTLRVLHRASAVLIATYAIAHIANHLVSLAGVQAHIDFMEIARGIYRQRYVEIVLLVSVGFQIASGLWFVFRDWKKRQGRVACLQAASGAYLAFFLLVHVAAVLFGRFVLNLDTNFYFAAAGFYVSPYQFFFAPYYFLAVLAIFTHLGCAVYWRIQSASRTARTLTLTLPILSGCAVSLLIVLSLAGMIKPVEVPVKYKATYVQTDG
jgi:succinate dehydrogenase/fumarate reductase cytochrome b subunit